MSLWLQWQKQFSQATPPVLQKVRDNLLQQIEGQNIQAECNMLSQSLNSLIRSVEFQQFGNELLNTIVTNSNIDLSSLGQISFKTSKGMNQNLALKSAAASAKWREFSNLANTMSKEQKKMELANPESSLAIKRAEALSLNGKLNHIKKQLMESLLLAVNNTFATEVIEVAEQGATNALTELLKTNLPNVLVTGGEDLLRTQGSETGQVKVVIGDTYLKTITTQKKVDVTVQSPFLNGSKWYMSAKNYSTLRDIDLLSKGSLIGLISQGFDARGAKYVYNAFSIPDSDWTSVNMHQLKQIFAIQALTGQKAGEVKSNVLVLSLNDRVNPIRIVSTYALLQRVFNDTQMQNTAFKFSPELSNTIPVGTSNSRKNEPNKLLNNIAVSIALNRSTIMARYVATLV